MSNEFQHIRRSQRNDEPRGETAQIYAMTEGLGLRKKVGSYTNRPVLNGRLFALTLRPNVPSYLDTLSGVSVLLYSLSLSEPTPPALSRGPFGSGKSLIFLIRH